jgi:hypothetical protein
LGISLSALLADSLTGKFRLHSALRSKYVHPTHLDFCGVPRTVTEIAGPPRPSQAFPGQTFHPSPPLDASMRRTSSHPMPWVALPFTSRTLAGPPRLAPRDLGSRSFRFARRASEDPATTHQTDRFCFYFYLFALRYHLLLSSRQASMSRKCLAPGFTDRGWPYCSRCRSRSSSLPSFLVT